MLRLLLASLIGVAGLGAPAEAGFRSPKSLVRNVYAHYGHGAPEFSKGLPRDEDTAKTFFDPSLRIAWTQVKNEPYDFLVQSPTWQLSALSISILRKQYDRTYVAVAFNNQGRPVTLRLQYLVQRPRGLADHRRRKPRQFLAHVSGAVQDGGSGR